MMTSRLAYVLAFLLMVALPCLADSPETPAMTPEQYRAELERLMSATEHLDEHDPQITQLLNDLPSNWTVQSDSQKFEISTEWLREDLIRIGKKYDANVVKSIHAHLQALHDDFEAYEN